MTEITAEHLMELLPEIIAAAIREAGVRPPDVSHGLMSSSLGTVVEVAADGFTADVQLDDDEDDQTHPVQLSAGVAAGDRVAVLHDQDGFAVALGGIGGGGPAGGFWAYDGSTLQPDPTSTTPLANFAVNVVDGVDTGVVNINVLAATLETAAFGLNAGDGTALVGLGASNADDTATSNLTLDGAGSFSIQADDGTSQESVEAGGGNVTVRVSDGGDVIARHENSFSGTRALSSMQAKTADATATAVAFAEDAERGLLLFEETPLYFSLVDDESSITFTGTFGALGALAVYAFDNAGNTELRVKYPDGTIHTIDAN